jgi:hypothetical protein
MDEKTKQTKSRTRAASCKAAAVAKAEASVAIKHDIAEAVKRKAGQPTKFNRDLWERVLEAVATYQDLIEICTADDMPAVSTIYRWMREDDLLKEEMRGAWEMFSMLGKSYNQNVLRGGKMSSGDVRRDIELANDNRWFMAKTNRRDFGDRQQIDVTVQEPFVLEGWMLPGKAQDVIDVKPDEDAE